jgi:DNA-binding NarL/FixJ family response regulator
MDISIKKNELTDKEHAVYRLVLKGLSNREIATQLGTCTERTIETHMRNILRKLDCKNRVQLIVGNNK